MIEIIERMSAQRAEFIAYCTGILSSESMLWVRRLFSNINKEVAINKDDEFAVKVWPLYSNILRFVKEFLDDECAGAILVTLYVCGIELGILNLGDEVETYKDFAEYVDSSDWSNMSHADVIKFDFYCESVIMHRAVSGNNDYGHLAAGGLRSLSMLDYLACV